MQVEVEFGNLTASYLVLGAWNSVPLKSGFANPFLIFLLFRLAIEQLSQPLLAN